MIHFLRPEFLYGLFALIIPVIIHLFSFKRYKKVYFSNFNFLLSLQQEKRNSSKVKKWLLLLLRMVVMAAIVIAFARPYIPPASSGRAQQTAEQSPVIIYIDNSFSMSNSGAHGSLLEEAKKYMFDILNSYPAGTGFMLLTNDNDNNIILSKEEASGSIAGIKTGPASKNLSEIFKQAAMWNKGEGSTLFLLSDFQKHICDFQSVRPDSLTVPVFLMLKPENINNLFIQDVGFDQTMLHRKNQSDRISIQVANSSGKDFNNVPISLSINDKKKSVSKVNIPENRAETVHINYLNTENGFYRGMVEISDFPVLFDNKFYFSYEIDDKINVLCLEQEKHNPFFGKLFADTSDFQLRYLHISRTANINFNHYNLIILDRLSSLSSGVSSELENYVNAGGHVFILPGNKVSTNVFNQLLRKMHAPVFGDRDTNMYIADIEYQASLFKNAFEKEEKNTVLPFASTFYPLTNNRNTDILLKDKRNNTVLASQAFGQGKVYISAFDFAPENGDMVYHPLFVPLMVNMSYNIQSALNTSWFLGSNKPVSISGKKITDNSRLLIRKEDGTFEFIPEIRKDFNGNYALMNPYNIQDAGIYEVMQDNKVIDILAFNYDRKESELVYCDEKELQKQFPTAKVENIKTTLINRNSELVKEIVFQDKNKYLSWWFILLAAITLLAEQFVWRRKLK
ncbi:BatA domain-containing protein [Odoribacter sp. OttesenSCG-928-J03]|nr:BatA domain-containing protein [Odoribacter sp. OttesenSCG-928-J03]